MADSSKSEVPRGAFIPCGLILGAGVGLIAGLVFGNLAIGVALGAGIGLMGGVVLTGSASTKKNS